jgi:hypothetical protein
MVKAANPIDAQILLLARSESVDGRVGKGSRLRPIAALLSRTARWLPLYRGFAEILQEIYSCYHRIALSRKMQMGSSGIQFQRSRESVLTVTFPHNCTENLACTLSIQALGKARPYLALSDHELFVQAWFQAARYYSRKSNTQLHKVQQDLPSVSCAALRVGTLEG